jgi:hypothetical protein
MALRAFRAEDTVFGRAYAAACVAGAGGMIFSAMLADWVFPFVYNIGLRGYGSAMMGWFLLGGLVVLEATRTVDPPSPDGDHYPIRPGGGVADTGARPALRAGRTSQPVSAAHRIS